MKELAIPAGSALAHNSAAPIPAPALRRRRRWGGCAVRALLGLVLLGGAASLTLKVFGNDLLPPLVDGVRAVVGPEGMAEIEARYYGFVETTHQWQRDWGLVPPVAAPWVVHTPAARRAVTTPRGGGRVATGSFGPGWPPAPAARPPATLPMAPAPATPAARPTGARPRAPAPVTATMLPAEVATVLKSLPGTLPPTGPPAARPTRTPRRAAPTRTRPPRRVVSPTATAARPTETASPPAAPPTAEAARPTETAPAPAAPPTPEAALAPPTSLPARAPPAAAAAQPTPATLPPSATVALIPAEPAASPVALVSPTVPADSSGGGQLAAPPLPDDGPPPLYPLIPDGGLTGEGQWTSEGLPAPPSGGTPAFWKTYLRPDAARPDALVYLVRFDPRRVHLRMVAGTQEPISPTGMHGAGQVAPADVPNLAGAFNGGWKSVHGNYGMMVDGRQVAAPNPRDDTATLALHTDGRVELGAWKTLRAAPDLLSYRQNCPLLIDNGRLVVQGHIASTWGLSLLSEMYIWRSGVGMTADGYLIYAAGNPISADELAVALQQAGAVYGMQLDINSAFVHWLNYTGDANGKVHADPLVPGMAYRRNDYLTPGQRDFFYLTWK